jgi:hypothetical protein
MKKVVYLSIILLSFISLNSFAGSGEKFTYDPSKIESQMSRLTELEHYLINNPGTTLTQMAASGNTLVDGVEVNPPAHSLFEDKKPRSSGSSGFILGCCLGSGLTAVAAAGVAYWLYYVYLQTVVI